MFSQFAAGDHVTVSKLLAFLGLARSDKGGERNDQSGLPVPFWVYSLGLGAGVLFNLVVDRGFGSLMLSVLVFNVGAVLLYRLATRSRSKPPPG